LIREAAQQDLSALVDLTCSFQDRIFEKDIEVDVAKMRYTYMAHIVSKDCFSMVSDAVQGALFGSIKPHWYSNDLVASDLFFCCADGSGVQLLRAFLKWAEGKRAKMIGMHVGSGMKMDRSGRLFELHGFTHVGGLYRRMY